MAVLTLNDITDVVTLVRLSIIGPIPYAAGRERGHAAVVAIDVRFSAGLWGLAVAESTRCRVHLECLARLLPDWPTQP